MPAELSNPEGMFPFHYNTLYDPGKNFDTSPMSLTTIIQQIAARETGHRLTKEQVEEVVGYLGSKGMLYRNPGEQAFEDCIVKYVRSIRLARKVATRLCQI